MLPFEIRATAPLYFNDYAAGNFSRSIFHLYAALPPCYDVPVLKGIAHLGRSRAGTGGKHYQQLFALIKNPKYVKMRLPKNGRPSKLNNTANAGRIV